MLHACIQRFDMTKNLEKFCKILETKKHPSRFPKTMWDATNSLISVADSNCLGFCGNNWGDNR